MTELKDIYREMNLIEANALLEKFMAEQGKVAFEKALEKNRKHGMASAKATRKTIGIIIEPYAQAIKEATASKGKAGRKHAALENLTGLDPYHVAMVTLRVIFDNISKRTPLSKVANEIARTLLEELNIMKFKDKYSQMFEVMVKDMNARSMNVSKRAYVFRKTFNKDTVDLEWLDFEDKQEARTLGAYLVTLLVENVGVIEIYKEKNPRSKRVTQLVRPTKDLIAFLDECNEVYASLTPKKMPTIVPPVRWEGMFGGGYHTEHMPDLCLLRSRDTEHLKLLSSKDLSQVYHAVNSAQETAYRINKKVKEVMEHAYSNRWNIKGLPDSVLPTDTMVDKPNLPYEEWTPEQKKEVRRQRIAHLKNQREIMAQFSRNNDFMRTMSVANIYENFLEFFYPHNLDYRGRIYPIASSTQLHPQGCDFGASLLEFSNGKPLMTDSAEFWFKVQGANTWGEDKVTFQERTEWVDANTHMIYMCGKDPIANTEWTNADKPFAFLAFCLEYTKWTDEPETFVSHLIVQMDGSNNGLQHLSAMLRDEVGGKSVNLIPTGEVEDVYLEVADKVNYSLERIIQDKEEGHELADFWQDVGVDRNATKRTVMVVPYAGTIMSARQYVGEYLEGKIKDDKELEQRLDSLGVTERDAVQFLTPILWQAISDVIVKGREVMEWFKKLGRTVSKYNTPIVWELPTGMVVKHSYKNTKPAQVRTMINGSSMRVAYLRELDGLNPHKQASALSPNIVHSLDACALMMTVNRCVDEGIYDFALIHDSYGTHAADAGRLAHNLREAFVELYSNFDIIQQLYDKYGILSTKKDPIPTPPSSGSLDITDVVNSAYFFA